MLHEDYLILPLLLSSITSHMKPTKEIGPIATHSMIICELYLMRSLVWLKTLLASCLVRRIPPLFVPMMFGSHGYSLNRSCPFTCDCVFFPWVVLRLQKTKIQLNLILNSMDFILHRKGRNQDFRDGPHCRTQDPGGVVGSRF